MNITTGPGDVVGDGLAKNEEVDMVSLTGDTARDKKVMEVASRNVKRVRLELGGKAPSSS